MLFNLKGTQTVLQVELFCFFSILMIFYFINLPGSQSYTLEPLEIQFDGGFFLSLEKSVEEEVHVCIMSFLTGIQMETGLRHQPVPAGILNCCHKLLSSSGT